MQALRTDLDRLNGLFSRPPAPNSVVLVNDVLVNQ